MQVSKHPSVEIVPQELFNNTLIRYMDFDIDDVEALIVLAESNWKWVDSKGWHSDKRPLEYISLIASEVYEVWTAVHNYEDSAHELELADIFLRVTDFIKELSSLTQGQLTLKDALFTGNVLDNRFKLQLNQGVTLDGLLLCMYHKLASTVNYFRDHKISPDHYLDIESAFNQVLYLTFVAMKHLQVSDVIEPIKTKLDINSTRKVTRLK